MVSTQEGGHGLFHNNILAFACREEDS